MNKIEKNINELKEKLLNKELTLLEMDNTIIDIVGNTNSLFDEENICIEQKSCSYHVDFEKNIIVCFEIIKKENNNLETLIKVTEIWED